MANYWDIVNDVIRESDILLIIADARFPKDSLNQEALDKIEKGNKKYLIVFNKCDLISATKQAEIEGKIEFSAFVSAIKHQGTMNLLRKINAIAGGKKAVVGILGYPNMGKSSVINALRGKKSAPVSPISGFTRGIQKIRITKNVILMDTPGVIPYNEKDEFLEVLIGAKDATKIKDLEFAAMELIEHEKGRIEKHYGVEVNEDSEETLEAISLKKKVLKKGGKADLTRMGKLIIQDWQTGKIKEEHE